MTTLLMRLRTVSIILLTGLFVCTATGVQGSHAQAVAHAQQSDSDLVRELGSDDAMKRAAAACELGERGAVTSVPSLIKLLADDTSISPFSCSNRWGQNEFNSPGREAAHALIEIGQQSAEAVFGVLDHSMGSIREKAVWVLGALDYLPAVNEILGMLGNDAYFLARANSAWALGAMDVSKASTTLRSAVRKDNHFRVREQAAWALGALDAKDAVEELMQALNDSDADVREQAAWALGAIGDPRGAAELVGALRDTHDGVRSQAAWALGAIGDSRGVNGLVQALEDESVDVRSQAAWALGAIGDPRAADGLTVALKDASANVRKQAVWALGALR